MTKPNRIWVHGANGRMGTILQKVITENSAFELVGGSGKDYLVSEMHKETKLTVEALAKELKHVDTVVDFSTPDGHLILQNAAKHCANKSLSLLIATTGLSEACINDWSDILQKSEMRLLFARNTSLGVLLTVKASLSVFSVVKDLGFDVEIHESHHRNKLDAPSGTALLFADSLVNVDNSFSKTLSHQGGRKDKTIGLSYTRGGQVFGEHTISFLGEDEEIRISHRALSRKLFANGALILADWLQRQKKGQYNVESINPEELLRKT